MIAFFRSWCEGIIVAVIISIIIESILPEGNHKKYVKVVVGVYIIFTILNPFLEKVGTKVEWEKNLHVPTIETSSANTENIRKLYTNGIEETLKTNIEEKFGHKVDKIDIKYDKNYEIIENINLFMQTSSVNEIEKIEIGQTNNEIIEKEENYSDIKKYISENYEIEESKIFIN